MSSVYSAPVDNYTFTPLTMSIEVHHEPHSESYDYQCESKMSQVRARVDVHGIAARIDRKDQATCLGDLWEMQSEGDNWILISLGKQRRHGNDTDLSGSIERVQGST